MISKDESMLNQNKILALIPARGGSKGVPRKNIRLLGGKPLLAWTIDAAKKSKYIDRLILSSDDQEIISVAEQYGCEVPFVRPSEFASDTASGVFVVLHAIESLEEKYDYVVLLQPTSPFRSSEDIDRTIARCITENIFSCVSVTESEKHPAWMFRLTESNLLIPVLGIPLGKTNRQQLEPSFVLNGAVYVMNVSELLEQKKIITRETLGYCMPKERSLDIDTLFDFEICEFIVRNMRAKR